MIQRFVIALKNDFKTRRMFLCFFFYFVFFYITQKGVPPVYDDLLFASYHFSDFSDIFHHALYYGNGRLLGNLLAITLSTYPSIAVVVKALVLAPLLVLTPIALGIEEGVAHSLFRLLFLTISAPLYAQVITWTSGFANYVPPILCMVLCLLVLRSYEAAENKKIKALFLACTGVLSLSAQLFIEHGTIIGCIAAFSFFLYRVLQKKGIKSAAICIGASICGAIIMLLIPKLFIDPQNTVDSYRSISGFSQLLREMAGRNNEYLSYLRNNIVLCCFMALSSILLLRASSLPKGIQFGGVAFLVLISVSQIALFFISIPAAFEKYGKAVTLFSFFCLFLSYFCLLIAVRKEKASLPLALFVLGILTILPLLVVNRSVERCILLSVFFLMCSLVTALAPTLTALDADKSVFIRRMIRSIILIVMFYQLAVFHQIHADTRTFTAHIEREMASGRKQITIFSLPQNYVHRGGIGALDTYYYYKEPGDIEFIVIDRNEWMDIYA